MIPRRAAGQRDVPLVTFDITTSLDGYVPARDAGREHPLGEGGDRLHEWLFGLRARREEHGEPGREAAADDAVAVE
jgi:hypothetical protein